MATMLIVIYFSFISLGLPDSLLGSAWPVMHVFLNVNIAYAGILSAISSIFTMFSSLLAFYMNKKFGTGKTIAYSTLLTSFALFFYSVSTSFLLLIPLSCALGFGGGAIDAALNNYVSLNYKSKHMSFLHACWGVGATLGPIILSFGLSESNYQMGYRIISIIQFFLAIIQFASISKFDAVENEYKEIKKEDTAKGKITGKIFLACLSFFLYCAVENSLFIWIATFFVNHIQTGNVTGAHATSMFFFGITGGRLLSGFISDKIGSKKMIYIGCAIAILSGVGIALSNNVILSMIIFLIAGIGFGPIFPSMMYRTPKRFGIENSSKIIGRQMASASAGSLVGPPLMGLLILNVSYYFIPLLIGLMGLLLVFVNTIIEKK